VNAAVAVAVFVVVVAAQAVDGAGIAAVAGLVGTVVVELVEIAVVERAGIAAVAELAGTAVVAAAVVGGHIAGTVADTPAGALTHSFGSVAVAVVVVVDTDRTRTGALGSAGRSKGEEVPPGESKNDTDSHWWARTCHRRFHRASYTQLVPHTFHSKNAGSECGLHQRRHEHRHHCRYEHERPVCERRRR